MRCYNVACPFRNKQENRCQLIECDWVGGTAREPNPITAERRDALVANSPFIHTEDGELL